MALCTSSSASRPASLSDDGDALARGYGRHARQRGVGRASARLPRPAVRKGRTAPATRRDPQRACLRPYSNMHPPSTQQGGGEGGDLLSRDALTACGWFPCRFCGPGLCKTRREQSAGWTGPQASFVQCVPIAVAATGGADGKHEWGSTSEEVRPWGTKVNTDDELEVCAWCGVVCGCCCGGVKKLSLLHSAFRPGASPSRATPRTRHTLTATGMGCYGIPREGL